MYTTVPMEAVFFLSSIGAGSFVAFLYDLLRIYRQLIRPKVITVNLQDILFTICAAMIVFYVAYIKNSGEIRWHGFIGCGTGAGLYVLIVRNRFRDAGTFLVKWTVKIAEKILSILFFPVWFIFKIFKKPIGFVMWYTCRGMRHAKNISKRGIDKTKLRLKNVSFMLRKK